MAVYTKLTKKDVEEILSNYSIGNLKEFKKNTDAICASNVICHIPDLKGLMLTVDQLLSKKGVFVFEEPYMGSMFDKVSYDQIYDEHVFLFSALSVLYLLLNLIVFLHARKFLS